MLRTRKFWINYAIGVVFFLSISILIDAFTERADWSLKYFLNRFFVASAFAFPFGYILSRGRPSSNQ